MQSWELVEAPSALYRGARCLLVFPEQQEVLGVPARAGPAFHKRREVSRSELIHALEGLPGAQEAIGRIATMLETRGLMEESRRWKGPPPPDHAVLNLSVSETCNLRCPHCYAEARPVSDRSELDVPQIMEDFEDTFGSASRREIVLTGGEPTIWAGLDEAVDRAACALRSGGLSKAFLNTNATRLSPDQARRLAGAGMRVSVSLDGPEAESHDRIRGKGMFAATLCGLGHLREAGVEFGANAFIHSGNLDRLERLVDLAVELGAVSFTAFGLMAIGRGSTPHAALPDPVPDHQLYAAQDALLRRRPDLVSIFKGSAYAGQLMRVWSRSRTRCGVGRHPTFYVRSTGDAYPCLAMFHPRFHLGDVREGFDQLWSHALLDELASRDPVDAIEECRSCPVRHFCGGGCPGENHQSTGSLAPSREQCENLKRGIEEILWILADSPLYLKHLGG